MARILLVVQDKGGVGKSVIARALAAAVPEAPVIEVDAAQRLIELKSRVSFYPMRATREEIERTGGKAARSEFDPVITALATARLPTIADIGANTSSSFLTLLADLAPDLTEAGVELGVLVVVTAEPGALAEAPRLLGLAQPFAKARFVIENRLRGEVEPKLLAKISAGTTLTTLAEQVMEERAVEILQAGGFETVPQLDPAKLNQRHGLALGARIRRDLTRFRAEAMAAVAPAAEWLVA